MSWCDRCTVRIGISIYVTMQWRICTLLTANSAIGVHPSQRQLIWIIWSSSSWSLCSWCWSSLWSWFSSWSSKWSWWPFCSWCWLSVLLVSADHIPRIQKNTKETQDTQPPEDFLEADSCEECKRYEWECKEWEWEEYGINKEEPDFFPCRGLFKQERKLNLSPLSAGGAFVLLESNFPPLQGRCPSQMPLRDPSPKKVPLI